MSKLVTQLEEAQRRIRRAETWADHGSTLFFLAIEEAGRNPDMDPTSDEWGLVSTLELCIENAKEALRLVRTAK